ncbi:MAG TPA: sulfur oxidation c-type cytochrome SoxA [Usitatibacteraceae bacterium]|nr:sulfur oxidation c-type cytochrome SoxA [Usitatibacteraceae bacterium]
MRFPERRLRIALLFAVALPLHAWAGAESVRTDIVNRIRSQYPALAPADLGAGSAAFDSARLAEAERNRPAPGAAEAVDAGRRIWTRKFAKGRSLAGCFPNGGRRVAAAYPQYDQRVKGLVTLETAINQCLKTHGQPLLEPGDPDTMGVVLAYLRTLSTGQKIAVRVASAQAEARFEEGRRLYFTRMGQQNYSCASCHVNHAGKFFGDAAIPAPVGAAAQWPYLRDGRPVTLQMRIRECLDRMGAAPFPAGSDELAHLDYFLSYLSNGLVVRPNEWRPHLVHGNL